MKVGDLVKIVWTEGCETAPLVVGIVTHMRTAEAYRIGTDQQMVQLLSNGKRSWFNRGDLRVITR